VVFDRYYDDVRIDPTRYRYGGPQLLARLVRPLIPQPDVTLVLDAPEDIVLSRKAELTVEELARQRRLYRDFQMRFRNVYLVDTASSPADVRTDASNVVAGILTRRLIQRYQRWLPEGHCDGWTYSRQGQTSK
jgi:thymidylate kinase